MSEQLLPCPFCGSTKLSDPYVRDGRSVACECGASIVRHHGPGGDTRARAIAAWNARSHESERVKGLERALRDMRATNFGVSGLSAQKINEWFNEAADAALSSIPGEAVLAGEGKGSAGGRVPRAQEHAPTPRPAGGDLASAFALDTSGSVSTAACIVGRDYVWADLTPFQQGYVEALLREAGRIREPGQQPQPRGLPRAFSDLAPETLALILKDCEAAQRLIDGGAAEGRMFWRGRSAWVQFGFPPLTVSVGDDGKIQLAARETPSPAGGEG